MQIFYRNEINANKLMEKQKQHMVEKNKWVKTQITNTLKNYFIIDFFRFLLFWSRYLI